MAEFKDIYNGEIMSAWEDGEFIFASFHPNGCTLMFTPEDWKALQTEFRMMSRGGLRVLGEGKAGDA